MLTLHVAAATLILNVFPPSVSPAPDAAERDEPAGSASVCPIPGWGGRCAVISHVQRKKIRTAVTARAKLATPTCQVIHALLVDLLESPNRIWTFEEHQHDTADFYVLGEAVRDAATGEPQGFGLRVAAFHAGSRTLARAALHESAHLTGQDERGAAWVERHCVS